MQQISLPELVSVLERAGNLQLAQRAVRRGLVQSRPIVIRGVRECFVNQRGPRGEAWPPLKFSRPGSDGGDVPLRDTGRLMASITASSNGDTIQVGTNRGQARLMHFGGVVRPVKGKYLAIPKTPEAKRAGSPTRFRGELRPLLGKKGGVMVGPLPNPKYRALGLLPVQFILTKESKIPPRPFVGFSRETCAEVLKMVTNAWASAIVREAA